MSIQYRQGLGVAQRSESTKDMQSIFKEIGRRPVGTLSNAESLPVLYRHFRRAHLAFLRSNDFADSKSGYAKERSSRFLALFSIRR